MPMFLTIIISLITGIVSGVISGFIVYEFTKRAERKRAIELYWENYLFKALEFYGVDVPNEMIAMLEPMGGLKGEFGKAIMNIYNIMHPLSDKEIIETKEQKELLENFKIAFSILKERKKGKKVG